MEYCLNDTIFICTLSLIIRSEHTTNNYSWMHYKMYFVSMDMNTFKLIYLKIIIFNLKQKQKHKHEL